MNCVNMQLHEKKKFLETDGDKVFVYKCISEKKWWFVKAINLKGFI